MRASMVGIPTFRASMRHLGRASRGPIPPVHLFGCEPRDIDLFFQVKRVILLREVDASESGTTHVIRVDDSDPEVTNGAAVIIVCGNCSSREYGRPQGFSATSSMPFSAAHTSRAVRARPVSIGTACTARSEGRGGTCLLAGPSTLVALLLSLPRETSNVHARAASAAQQRWIEVLRLVQQYASAQVRCARAREANSLTPPRSSASAMSSGVIDGRCLPAARRVIVASTSDGNSS